MSNKKTSSFTDRISAIGTYTGIIADLIAIIPFLIALLVSVQVITSFEFDILKITINFPIRIPLLDLILVLFTYGFIAVLFGFIQGIKRLSPFDKDKEKLVNLLRRFDLFIVLLFGLPITLLLILFNRIIPTHGVALIIILFSLTLVFWLRWKSSPSALRPTARFHDIGYRYLLAIPFLWFIIQLGPNSDWIASLTLAFIFASAGYLASLLIAKFSSWLFQRLNPSSHRLRIYFKSPQGRVPVLVASALLAIGVISLLTTRPPLN